MDPALGASDLPLARCEPHTELGARHCLAEGRVQAQDGSLGQRGHDRGGRPLGCATRCRWYRCLEPRWKATRRAVGNVDALPEVVEAVQGKIPVHFDGGVRHGTDAFKALALGAAFVWIGRPTLWGLAYKGEEG